MHVVGFDIDGTLVSSAGIDGELYEQSIRDVLGVELRSDLALYENVSDSGILAEVLADFPDPDERDRLA